MIEYLIGVDGGGTGTRVRLARARRHELAQGQSGPSGLAHGIDGLAWHRSATRSPRPSRRIGWPAPFGQRGHRPRPGRRAQQGLGGAVRGRRSRLRRAALETDGYTTLMGAHQGRPGTIVAIGTGSVGQALLPTAPREVGGWGFPAGDEASGGWIGLRAINHIEQVHRRAQAAQRLRPAPSSTPAAASATRSRSGSAPPPRPATPAGAARHRACRHRSGGARLPADAGKEVASIARALDPSGTLPLALCGGLGAPLRAYLPPELLARSVAPCRRRRQRRAAHDRQPIKGQ
jgi:glucosamine kinase